MIIKKLKTMRKWKLAIFCALVTYTAQAQNLGLNVTGTVSYITVSDNFTYSIKKNTESRASLRLDENAVSVGVEASAFFKSIMLGGGLHRFSINPNKDNRFGLTSYSPFGMVGYNFSKNDRTQLLPALRFGILVSNLEVPFAEDDTRMFGNALVEDGVRFRNTSLLVGAAITANRHFGNSATGFSIGVGAFYDYAFGDTNWNKEGIVVDDLNLNAYSYYGLCLKLSGGWNQYDGY